MDARTACTACTARLRAFTAAVTLPALIALVGVLPGCRGSGATNVPADATLAVGVASKSAQGPKVGTEPGQAGRGTPLVAAPGHALAAFAGGCFWGSENTFRHVPGVVATAVGYAGGHTEAPTYESVCAHGTGHAEVVLVEFDPAQVSYEKLLETFWSSHDPTTKNRQGPDIGDQYRSAIYTLSAAQEAAARASMATEQTRRARPITTELGPLKVFWKAEDYHQQYDEKTGRESCPLPGARGT